MEVTLQKQQHSFICISNELDLIVVGGTFTVPSKHRVVWLLLFLLMLLTHIQRGQINTQEFSNSLSAVNVSVLIQNLDKDNVSHINLLHRSSNNCQKIKTSYLSFDEFVPIVVWERAVKRLNQFVTLMMTESWFKLGCLIKSLKGTRKGTVSIFAYGVFRTSLSHWPLMSSSSGCSVM